MLNGQIVKKHIFKYFNKESLKYDMKNNKYYEDFVISLSKHIYALDEEYVTI